MKQFDLMPRYRVLVLNFCLKLLDNNRYNMGSGCGAVGRVVASNTRDPRFESSQRQYYLLSTVLKRRKKKKRGQEWPYFLKKGNVPLKFYNH